MSAFKTLFSEFVKNEGKSQGKMFDRQLKVFVNQTSPHFLVADNLYFVPAYFTKAAVDNFHKTHSNVTVGALDGKVILISSWELELREVDSDEVWTSHSNLEVRLIVNEFKPAFQDTDKPVTFPSNLYRESGFKLAIMEFRHRSAASAIKNYKGVMAPLNGNKGSISQGVISLPEDKWNFVSKNTKTIKFTDKRSTPAKASVAKKVLSVKKSVQASAKGSRVGSVKKVLTAAKIKKSVAKRTVSKQSALGSKKKVVSGRATTDKPSMAQYKKILAAAAASKKNKLSVVSVVGPKMEPIGRVVGPKYPKSDVKFDLTYSNSNTSFSLLSISLQK